MTAVIGDLQDLLITDSYISLYEIELNTTTSIYFTNFTKYMADVSVSPNVIEGSPAGSPDSLIRFWDYSDNSVVNTYYPIPARVTGLEQKLGGQIPQPSLTIANVFRTLDASDSLQALLTESFSYSDLLGKKFTRRRTLKRFLYGEGESLPIEFPRDIFYLDSIQDENPEAVTFGLVAPTDLQNIKIPRRIITGSTCPWKFQGAAPHLDEEDKSGGCTWHTYGKRLQGGNVVRIYANEKDEYLIPSTLLSGVATYTSGSVTSQTIYKTSKSGLVKIQEGGTLLTGQSSTDYWQAIADNASPGTPTDANANWVRVWGYDNSYNVGDATTVYTDPNYNSYVNYNNQIWRARNESQSSSVTPESGSFYWERGDLCGKRLKSCRRRFQTSFLQTLAVASSSGFSAGQTIDGSSSGATAKIVSITGNTLYVNNIVGAFKSGETITGNVAAAPSTTVSSALSETNGRPTTDYNTSNYVPFGSFPSSRAF